MANSGSLSAIERSDCAEAAAGNASNASTDSTMNRIPVAPEWKVPC
ncbi:hypothetical protein [Bradyrhizobium sp. USDA 327]